MRRKLGLTRWGLIAACTLMPGAGVADCVFPPPPQIAEPAIPALPTAPDPGPGPERPACLGGLTDPSAESCTPAQIADYAEAVAQYRAALQAYVSEADRYASQSVARANAAVAGAEAAREYADAVFDYATCAAERIRTGAD